MRYNSGGTKKNFKEENWYLSMKMIAHIRVLDEFFLKMIFFMFRLVLMSGVARIESKNGSEMEIIS